MVLTHMLREKQPDIPVLFLDTFHHFAETLTYRDEMAQAWGLNLINLRAAEPRVGLWEAESTEACCARHKVGPLFSALEGYDVWFTALRRDQSASRATSQEVEPFRLPSGKTIQRVAPAGRVDGEGRLGATRSSTAFRCCRCTTSATRASAASRARRCRSTRRTRARDAGRARSSSAGFTSSPSRHSSPNSQLPTPKIPIAITNRNLTSQIGRLWT